MHLLDEFRSAGTAQAYAAALARLVTRPWTIMEVCGGQTHAILRYGLDQLLPPEVTLIHGPGCPVCVTPVELIDAALAIAARPEVIFCTFGDMLRVPGSKQDLFTVKSAGADIRVVYSPLAAVDIAACQPERQVVFFAVGFETTAPATAMAVKQATATGLGNFSLLVAHVLVPPAMAALLAAPGCAVQGFLAAGHVCTVTGYEHYHDLARRYRVPIVVTGFEPLDILQGLHMCLRQLEEGRAEVENQYSRSVQAGGNQAAWQLVQEVFQVTDRRWRGLAVIPDSGLALAARYAAFDAINKFGISLPAVSDAGECLSGDVLQGKIKPAACPSFGRRCTPEHPLGAPMVSSEGACAAYFRYRRGGTADHPAFGMWADHAESDDVDKVIRAMRKGRNKIQ